LNLILHTIDEVLTLTFGSGVHDLFIDVKLSTVLNRKMFTAKEIVLREFFEAKGPTDRSSDTDSISSDMFVHRCVGFGPFVVDSTL
jgi:hypothetical protein